MSTFQSEPSPREYYVTGGTLSADAASYVVRKSDTDLLTNLLRGEFCYVLNSRQMGKSSLMVRTIRHLQARGIRTAVLDLTAFGQNLTISHWYLGLLSRLGEQLDLEDELDTYWEEEDRFSPMQRWQGALTQIVLPQVSSSSARKEAAELPSPYEDFASEGKSKAKAPDLVIFVDEIDVVRSLSFSTDEFFAAIRYCYASRATEPQLEGLCFCLIGVATPSDLISNPHTSPFNIGRRVEMHDFTLQEAGPLALGLMPDREATQPLASGPIADTNGQRLLDRVLYWTGGHPYLTQKLCRAIGETAFADSTVSLQASDVDQFCEAVFLSHQARESDDNLAFVRNTLIRSEVDLATLFDLYRRIYVGETESYDDTNPVCVVLRLSGIVEISANGRFSIRNRIYERVFDAAWIEQYRSYPQAPKASVNVQSSLSLGNLPFPLTSFVGKENEIAEIISYIEKAPLVTLIGMGGTGKTRLSIQVSQEKRQEYSDGIWFVELAALTDPGLVIQTIAGVLGIREETETPLVQTVLTALKPKRLLLVLDNCEHLLTACAHIANVILHACPQIRILASSREALRIPGEQVVRVLPLSLPPAEEALSLMQVNDYEAPRLFMERALSCVPAFVLNEKSISAFVSICRRLDGIPLALELAAARVRTLSVEDINGRLDNRFRLLTGGSRTALPRQQTLRALVDWSYDLLTEQEQLLFARLSVFAGGWDLSAAEAICADDGIEDWEIFDLLTALVDKSLVVCAVEATATRFRLLETLRKYGMEKLKAFEDAASMLKRHAEYYAALAVKTEPLLLGPEQSRLQDQLEEEHDNMRAALAWGRENPSGAATALKLTSGLWRFWMMRGYWREGSEHLKTTLANAATDADTLTRGNALNGAGMLSYRMGDFEQARALLQECIELSRQSGDERGMAAALSNLGHVLYAQGELAAAKELYTQGLAVYRKVGSTSGVAYNLLNLGNVVATQGDLAAARTEYGEALALFRTLGDGGGEMLTLGNLGQCAIMEEDAPAAALYSEQALELARELKRPEAEALYLPTAGAAAELQGDWQRARQCYLQALEVSLQLGDKRTLVSTLETLAEHYMRQNEAKLAAHYFGCTDAGYDRIGMARSEREKNDRDEAVTNLRAILGEEAFDSCWTAGRILSLEDAARDAIAGKEL